MFLRFELDRSGEASEAMAVVLSNWPWDAALSMALSFPTEL